MTCLMFAHGGRILPAPTYYARSHKHILYIEVGKNITSKAAVSQTADVDADGNDDDDDDGMGFRRELELCMQISLHRNG